MRKIIVIIIFFLFPIPLLFSKEFITVYNIYIDESKIGQDAQVESLWNTIKGQIIFQIKQINYYRLMEEKDMADIQVQFRLVPFINETNFTLKISFKHKTTVEKELIIQSKNDYELLSLMFIEELKWIFPLKGAILQIKGLKIDSNLGKNYNVTKGDLFFIQQKEWIKGVALVEDVKNYSSKLVITSYNQPINREDTLIPFQYEGNKKYYLYDDIIPNDQIKNQKTIRGLYGSAFKVVSSKRDNIFVADEKEMGIYDHRDNQYEKYENLNFNNLTSAQFNLNESYLGYVLKDGRLKLVKLQDNSLSILKWDKEKNLYFFIRQKEENLFPYTNIIVGDFCFYTKEGLIFYDQDNFKFVLINLNDNNNTLLNIPGILSIDQMRISPNYKKLIFATQKTNLFIYDMESEKIDKITIGEDNYFITKTGVNLFYEKNGNLFSYNFYTKVTESYPLEDTFNQLGLSFSERYLFYYNHNTLDIYDLLYHRNFKDVFQKNHVKSIEQVKPLRDDTLLLYGKLFDLDNNQKLDYRDLNHIVYFNFFTDRNRKIISGIDDFYGVSNYSHYIIYRNKKDLWIKRLNYEKSIK